MPSTAPNFRSAKLGFDNVDFSKDAQIEFEIAKSKVRFIEGWVHYSQIGSVSFAQQDDTHSNG